MTETHPTYITDRDKETLFKFASLFGADVADEIMKACLGVEYGSVTINIAKGKPDTIERTESTKVIRKSYSPDE